MKHVSFTGLGCVSKADHLILLLQVGALSHAGQRRMNCWPSSWYPVCRRIYMRPCLRMQELQRDIEQHTEGVASVLTLCEVLLRDADACGTETESESIQETTRSLDRRWRNICAMSMERRMRWVHGALSAHTSPSVCPALLVSSVACLVFLHPENHF